MIENYGCVPCEAPATGPVPLAAMLAEANDLTQKALAMALTIERAIEILDPDHREHYNGLDEVNEACRMGLEALKWQRWIPVEERLPEENVPVLGWYKDNPFASFAYEIVSWNGKGWVFVYAQRYVCNVTHWMPLPEPPEEER